MKLKEAFMHKMKLLFSYVQKMRFKLIKCYFYLVSRTERDTLHKNGIFYHFKLDILLRSPYINL